MTSDVEVKYKMYQCLLHSKQYKEAMSVVSACSISHTTLTRVQLTVFATEKDISSTFWNDNNPGTVNLKLMFCQGGYF